jgi:hypothetical protein
MTMRYVLHAHEPDITIDALKGAFPNAYKLTAGKTISAIDLMSTLDIPMSTIFHSFSF